MDTIKEAADKKLADQIKNMNEVETAVTTAFVRGLETAKHIYESKPVEDKQEEAI